MPINGKVFYDTNVLLYAADPSDRRGDIARHLLVTRRGNISVQVLNEFVSVTRRKLKRSWPELQAALGHLRVLFPEPEPITAETHDAAIKVAVQHQLSIYDALIVASATLAGCDILYSEDMSNAQRIGGVTIQNPFLK